MPFRFSTALLNKEDIMPTLQGKTD